MDPVYYLNDSQDPGHMQFLCSINDDKYEEVMSCNGMINHSDNHKGKKIA